MLSGSAMKTDAASSAKIFCDSLIFLISSSFVEAFSALEMATSKSFDLKLM